LGAVHPPRQGRTEEDTAILAGEGFPKDGVEAEIPDGLAFANAKIAGDGLPDEAVTLFQAINFQGER